MSIISGIVYNDLNFNGVYNAGEPGIANAYVVLYNTNTGVCTSTQTDVNGSYSFTVTTAGTYTIYETVDSPSGCPPTNFTQPTGFSGSNGPRKINVTLTQTQINNNTNVTNQNFGHDVNSNPLTCSNTLVQFAGGPASWYNVNLITGSSVNQGPLSPAQAVNATGYNTLDNYIYGYSVTNNYVVRVDSTGKVMALLPLPTGLAATGYNVGAMDQNGFYYIYVGATGTRFYTIDLRPNSPTYMKLVDPTNGYVEQTSNYGTAISSVANIYDWGFNIVDGFLYGVDTNTGRLLRINPQTGQTTLLNTINAPGGNLYGAIGTDAQGYIYAFANTTGVVYRYSVSGNTATAQTFSTSVANSQNDAAMCVNSSISLDFGDAPDTSSGTGADNYSTLLSNNGPRHGLGTPLYLGTQVTAETDAYQNSTATGDDISSGIQDDGLTLPLTPLLTSNTTYSVSVNVTNNTGKPANLYGWLDFNKSGVFQNNEASPVVVVPSSGSLQTVTLNFTLPAGVTLTAGHTFIRLRLTTDTLAASGAATAQDPRSLGPASNGEVEDYYLPIQTGPVTSTKAVDKEYASPGDVLTYTAVVKNTGATVQNNVVFQDTTPAGTTYVASSITATTGISGTDPNSGITITTINPGEAVTLTWQVTVNNSIPATNPIPNTGNTTLENGTKNTTNPVFTKINAPIINVAKGVNKANSFIGDTITYTITVTNTGNISADPVIVTDIVPNGGVYAANTLTVNGVANASDPNTGINIGALAPGATATIVFKVNISSLPSPNPMENTAVANFEYFSDPSSTTPDTGTSGSNTVTTEVGAVLTNKTVDKQTVDIGDIITYTVTITNAESTAVNNLVFQDSLPSGTTYVGNLTVSTGYTGSTPQGGLTITTINVGETVTISWQVQVGNTLPNPNPIPNTGNITYQGLPPQNTNTVETTVKTADISVVKTSSPAAVITGDTITYTLVVANGGPDPAQSVILTDGIPSEVTALEFSTDGGTNWNPWVTPYTIGTLASGSSVTILIRGIVTSVSTGTIDNTATVTSTTADPNPINNTSTVTTPLNQIADISVVKTADVNPIIAGNVLTYTMVVANAGPDSATNVILTDNIPGVIGNQQYSVDGGTTYNPWTGSVDLGTIASGGSTSVLIKGDVDPAATGTISNTATVASVTPDPNPTNNTSSVDVTVNTSADISVVKSETPDPVVAGQALTYTMVVANGGPSDAQAVLLADSIPPTILNTKYSIDGGVTFTSWTGSVNLGIIAAGGAITVLIQGTVDPAATGTISNTATVTSSTQDPDPTNNTSTTDTTVNTAADISVVKTANPDPIIAGNLLTYVIVVANAGPSNALAVTLTDAVPGTIGSPQYSLNGGTTYIPWTGSVDLGTIVADGFTTVLIQGTVDPAATGTISNTATVSSPTPDPDPTDNSSTVGTTVDTSADISVVKTGNPSTVVSGHTLTYTEVVTNLGPSDAQDVILTDAVPGTIGSPQYSLDGGVTYNTWLGSLSLGTIAEGGSVTVLIQGTVDPAATGTIINTATVDTTTTDPDPTNNTSTADTPIDNSADISVVKIATPSPVIAGEILTYTIVVSNSGPADALSVNLTDAVPAAIALPEYSTDGGANYNPWPGSVNLGTILAGGSTTVLIRGTLDPAATGTISNTATVTTTSPDPDPTNNTSTTDTTINTSADILVVKTDNPDPVIAGELLTYTMVVSNNGLSDALLVTLTDSVPAAIINPTYSLDGGGTYNPWFGSVNLGTLAAGGSKTVLIQGTVSPSATGTITNTATVTSPTTDPDPTNNTSTVDTTVNTSADISVVKTDSPDPVIAGEELTYTMVVSNGGPSDALSVTLTDAVPAAIALPQYSIDGGATYNPWSGSVDLGTIVAGGSITVLIKGTVDPAATGTLSNTATVSSPTPDPDPTNNTSTVDTTVNVLADVSVVKTANPDPAIAGQDLTYTMVVANAGPSDAQVVTLTDTVPANVDTPEYSLDGGLTYIPWTGSVDLGTIAAGGAINVLIKGTIDPSATGNIINTSSVTSPTPDPDPTNNTSSTDTTINTVADISVVKTDSPDPILAGQSTLTYTMVVSNLGPSDAQDVTLGDTVPLSLANQEYSLDGGVTYIPWTGSFDLGIMAPGTVVTVLIRGDVKSSTTGSIGNTATVTSPTTDPDPTNNTSTVDTTVNTLADISVVKTETPDPVIAGAQATYTQVVSNAGPSDAQSVTLTDAIPSSITNPEYSIDGGLTYNPWTGSLNLGTMAVGAVISVLIRGTAGQRALGDITNIAIVASPTPDPDPTNNTSKVTIVAVASTLEIAKAVDKGIVTVGGLLAYTIIISNTGTITATDVIFTDSIPAGTTFIENSVTLDGTTVMGVDPSTGIPLGDMAPGQSIAITFEVRSNDAITVNPVINEANVKYMANLCPTCPVQSVKTNSNTVATIIEPKTFKQLNVYDTLKIPSKKPDGEDIIDATVSAVITKIRIIKTPIGKSSDGKILTGWKAIIHGNLKQKVEYVADEPTQSVHLAHFCVPFSTFIVLPSDSQHCCPMTTVVTIEDVYATLLDKRTIFTNVTLLIQGNICS